MSRGELYTRITIWIALCGYAFGVIVILVFPGNPRWQARARWAWTLGCLGLLIHVCCAFHFYHNWSQSSAYVETARQTNEVFGINWGGGLFINYAFITIWVLDCLWWWRSLDAYRQRPLPLIIAWQSFLIFIIFNATVVFKTGPLRWLGLGFCLAVSILWWFTRRRRILFRSNDKSMMVED